MEIKVENLIKNYTLTRGVEVKAIRDINLDIKQGETVAITGPSGAGKSTLLHILGLMDRATSGKVLIDGADTSEFPEAQRSEMRRNKIGFLFQMHYLLPEFSLLENVLLPVWNNRMNKKSEILEMLEKLGLSERAGHLPSELSGGEQQRAALARALVNEPELLLADEPTGDLDRETGERVEQLIFDECKKRNVTLILVTHNDELAKKAGRIIRMRDGIIIAQPPAGLQVDYAAEAPLSGSNQQKYIV